MKILSPSNWAALAAAAALSLMSFHAALAAQPAPKLTAQDRQELIQIKRQVDGDLRNDILPFWTRDTVDPAGGFNTIVDRYGKPTSTDRYVVMQARMVWTLSAAQRYGVKDPRYLDLARKTIHYITDKMWDSQYGGFYMSTRPDGTPINDNKYLYMQEFVLYALSEYARDTPIAAEKDWALDWADKLFTLIQDRCADPQYGGYREDFDRQWKPLAESMGVGGVPSGKTLNTHMHLMEAFTALVDASPKPRDKQALGQVVDLLLAKTISPRGYAKEPFNRAWQPVPDSKGQMTVFYGHDVEFAWLLIDAAHALGRSPETIRPQVLGLIDHALTHGVDSQRGGIAGTGPRFGTLQGAPSYEGTPLVKDWWEQAEALTAYITAYRWTGNRKYLTAFEKEWGWVWRHGIDHQAGDWYVATDWFTGKPTTYDKGLGGWKVCYHDGRALMRVGEQLQLILNGSRQPI